MSYSLANAIQKIVPLAILPLVTAYLGANGLKLYDVAFTYAYLFSWLVILGQDAAASLYYFDNRVQQFHKDQVLSNAFFLQCFSFLVFAVVFVPFSEYFAAALFPGDTNIGGYWIQALLLIPGQILFNYALNILLWKERKKAYISLCIVQATLSVGSVYLFVVMLGGGIEALFISLICSISICGLAGLVLIGKHVLISPFPLQRELIRKLLLFGLPFSLTAFFQQLLPAIDRYFLLRFDETENMAQYILAVKMGAVVNLGISAFVMAFTPYSLKKLN